MKIIIAVIVFMSSMVSVSYSQIEHETTIDERLGIYIPIFTEPHCSKFLTDFGTNKSVVTSYAKNIGLTYFTTAPIPNLENVISDIYFDPSNIVHQGRVISEHVIYSFIFTDDGQYVSFSANIKFKTENLANSFFSSMLQKAGMKGKKKDHNGIVTCKLTGDQRSVILKIDGRSITYVVVDHRVASELSNDGGSKM